MLRNALQPMDKYILTAKEEETSAKTKEARDDTPVIKEERVRV